MIWTWLQQDGATSHTAIVTINWLENKFGERVISRNGRVGWPPLSCDLTQLDYFLWGYVKSMVKTIDKLRTNIERGIESVSANWCLNQIVKNWVQRLHFCKRARGGHAEEIEFHNCIERTFTGIKNFIDIQNRFCFIFFFEKPFIFNATLIDFNITKIQMRFAAKCQSTQQLHFQFSHSLKYSHEKQLFFTVSFQLTQK